MFPRRYALIGGIVMLAMGLLSLIPQLSSFSDQALPILKVEASYGLFLGLFAMNIFNKIALIILGVAGIWAAEAKFNSLPMSIWFSRAAFVILGVLCILGLFPQTNTLFGYWPLFGYTALVHAVFAVVGAYYGFALSYKASHTQNPVVRGV